MIHILYIKFFLGIKMTAESDSLVTHTWMHVAMLNVYTVFNVKNQALLGGLFLVN